MHDLRIILNVEKEIHIFFELFDCHRGCNYVRLHDDYDSCPPFLNIHIR